MKRFTGLQHARDTIKSVEQRLVAAAVRARVPQGVRRLEVAKSVVVAISTRSVGLVENQIAVVLNNELAAPRVALRVRRPLGNVALVPASVSHAACD